MQAETAAGIKITNKPPSSVDYLHNVVLKQQINVTSQVYRSLVLADYLSLRHFPVRPN